MRLNYYFDALCGWCYGFTPVIKRIEEEFQGKIEVEFISGGLFLDQRVGLINEVTPYIKAGAYLQVEQTTRVKFGSGFLEVLNGDGNMFLDSFPSAIAMAIVKSNDYTNHQAYGHALISGFYKEGLDPRSVKTFEKQAEKIGVDPQLIFLNFEDPKYKELAYQEFVRFQKSQFTGMPGVSITKDGVESPLAAGYCGFEVLIEKIKPYLN